MEDYQKKVEDLLLEMAQKEENQNKKRLRRIAGRQLSELNIGDEWRRALLHQKFSGSRAAGA